MQQYEGIVEVARGKWQTVNYYLAHDYKLLAVMSTNHARTRKDGQLYIHRGVEFVLGRTEDIPHVEPPESRPTSQNST